MIGYAQAVINQDATKVEQVGDEITISELDGTQWGEYESDNPAQGEHEWVAIGISTGERDLTKVTFNGTPLTQADVDEAASLGLGAGTFVLWVKADDTVGYPREITLGAQGKESKKITVKVVNN